MWFVILGLTVLTVFVFGIVPEIMEDFLKKPKLNTAFYGGLVLLFVVTYALQ